MADEPTVSHLGGSPAPQDARGPRRVRHGRARHNAPHVLKTWPFSFQAIVDGAKTFEVRKDDRGYLAGDWLVLREYLPEGEHYTGREVERQVTYILRGPGWGIEDGYVVMALAHLAEGEGAS